MKYFLFLLFTIFFQTFSQPSAGQPAPTYCYNLNIENGMPDNHIYRMITDRFGYLWIGTPKGVVRYNGYEFKTFTLADGLATDDVWDLYEDRKGRIWLGCRSPEFGYLYSNKYYKTYFKNFNQPLFPNEISSDSNGNIRLLSGIVNSAFDFYAEHNDTLVRYGIRYPNGSRGLQSGYSYPLLLPSSYAGFSFYGKLYAAIFPKMPNDTIVALKYICQLPEKMWRETKGVTKAIGDYLVQVDAEKERTIEVLNIKNGTVSSINLADFSVFETLHHLYPDRNDKYLYAICDSTLIRFDNKLRFIKKLKLSEIIQTTNVDGSKIPTLMHSSLWKICMGTTTNGVYVNNDVVNHFKRADFDLKNYDYIGQANDSVSLWWNILKKRLAMVTGTTKIRFLDCPDISSLRHAIPLKNGSSILNGSGLYILKKGRYSLITNSKQAGLFYDIVELENGKLLAATNWGLLEMSLDGNVKILDDKDRYKHITYDSLTKNYWVYNTNTILIHSSSGSHNMFSPNDLKKSGILKPEKVVVDNTYGNIILKGYKSVWVYNRKTNTFRQLFDSYNFEGALMEVCNNTLVIAGGFGVLFSKITGKNTFSSPILYSNLRNINYRQAYGITSHTNKLLLQTDNGIYQLQMPSDSAMKNAEPIKNDQYRLILNYRDTIRSIKSGDTVAINQIDGKLQFDVINPNGSGRLKYHVKLSADKAWSILNSNEITLPSSFAPDRYYTLYLTAQDNTWTSAPIKLKLYIQPYWWQTKLGRRSLWAAGIFSVILLLASSVLITRRLVLRASQKRSLQMELELKAIYAQINPHFIFNTLNSALLLVSKNKMEEAYMHISKFSRLLRSYIKSSRNRLISIADEIDNLEDYIELQQTRFKNKLSYEIIIDGTLDPARVHIPALLLQPFVENAINHGILPKPESGHLKIEFRKDAAKEEIVCTVEDDGVGRSHSNETKTDDETDRNKKESYGDLLIKDLVNIFNRFEHMNIAIRYVDKTAPLTGTIVYIQIKNPHHDK